MIKITIPELKELCKQNGLKGYSKLNKTQLIEYLSSYANSKPQKKSLKAKKMVKKSMKGGRMIGYGRDFYGEGLFDTIKSIAKKIPFAQIANVALEIAKEFLPNGKAKEIVDIAADITNKMVKEKEKEKEKEIKKVEKKEEEIILAPKKKIVLKRKAPAKTKRVIKSKIPKKY